MISLFASMACAALVFVEQDIPGVRVGRAEPLSGKHWRNFRQADIDGNGETDLVLPDCTAFQRDGVFRAEERRSLPYLEERPACDIHENTLFFRRPGRLTTVRWESGRWRAVVDQELAWPDALGNSDGTGSSQSGAPTAYLERFLHDVDGDGAPEIAVAAEDGLHLYRKAESEYVSAGVLDILPALELAPTEAAVLWPPRFRRVPQPDLQLSCRFFLTTNAAVVLQSHYLPDSRVRYRVQRFRITAKADGAFAQTMASEHDSPPLPSDMRPCRLNDDDAIDYAGGGWEYPAGSVVQAPIYETRASVDGGSAIQRVRSVAFRPACSFADFDHDGRLDMLTENAGLFAKGVRETLNRFASAHTLKHEVRVHLQDAEGRFRATPEARGAFRIALDKVPMRNGERFRRYQASELIDVTGDFDGDGRNDPAVHVSATALVVYRSSGKRLDAEKLLTAKTEPGWRFAVADIDGDGRDDVVFRWMDPASPEGYERCRVFLTRNRTP